MRSLTLFWSGGYQIDTCLPFSLYLRHGFRSESELLDQNRVYDYWLQYLTWLFVEDMFMIKYTIFWLHHPSRNFRCRGVVSKIREFINAAPVAIIIKIVSLQHHLWSTFMIKWCNFQCSWCLFYVLIALNWDLHHLPDLLSMQVSRNADLGLPNSSEKIFILLLIEKTCTGCLDKGLLKRS